MRFMLMTRADRNTEAGVPPTPEHIAMMEKGIGEMAQAGVLLSAEGLQSSAKGALVKHAGKRKTVIDGPFTEAKELIAGFVMIRVGSRDEAIEWAKRFPVLNGEEAVIEVRQLFDPEDFAPPAA